MLHSIAVHIHSVFCVPCTVCGVVLLCADTAIICGNCSAGWVVAHFSARALRAQYRYTCTEGSVSVHVHHQYSTQAHFKMFSVEVIYVILGKVSNSTQNDGSTAIM